ncbi:hypothetical protein A9Q79_05975 [Methylophaga sp. 42_25_T18]|nr:hypothetical protein A9Q79_05975 [Methylophaga sp. 42_25_T18]
MKVITTFLVLMFLVGCSHSSPAKRLASAEQLANENEWHQIIFKTSLFDLVSYVPENTILNTVLTVYIEGDGFAWRTSRQPSSDPTPHNPVALKLALKHQNGAAAYLARPCQYHQELNETRLCNQSYWTKKRYAEEVISASEQALTQLKNKYQANKLILVGYSGGAAVAALLAAQRDDVKKLITVAGNLDHQAWTEFHNVTPLADSLNPVDYLEQLQDIPQLHFVGEHDQNIPPKLAQDFIANYDSAKFAKVIVVTDQSHSCCWQEIWPKLILDNNIF